MMFHTASLYLLESSSALYLEEENRSSFRAKQATKHRKWIVMPGQ